jgi:CRP-like cAMP-binding protein
VAPCCNTRRPLFTQVAQTAVCNRLHSVEQRLARSLLFARDRMERNELPLTHELLAKTLGCNRPTVSLAASLLQQADLIRYHRGKVNQRALEEASCPCYALMKRQYQRLGC